MQIFTFIANTLVVGCSVAALLFVVVSLVKLSHKRLGMWYLMLGAAFVLGATLMNAAYWASFWAFSYGLIEWRIPILDTANAITASLALAGTYILSIVGWYAQRGGDWGLVAKRITQGAVILATIALFLVGWSMGK